MRLGFYALSRLRGARIFHPEGIGYEGYFDPGASTLLSAGPVQARLSRAVGLPDSVPDLLGLALRLVDAHGADAHQDFLLVSSGEPPLARHALLPGVRGFFAHRYSSLLPYRADGRLGLFGARFRRPTARGSTTLTDLAHAMSDGAELTLSFGRLLGGWREIGAVTLESRLGFERTEDLRFNPWNSGGKIEPAAPLMAIRAPAYAGSQQGRLR